MSLDRSLKAGSSLSRHRNVLTRAERLERLADEDKWEEGKDSVFGLPKVAHRKLSAGKKTKKPKTEEAAAETETKEAETSEAPKE